MMHVDPNATSSIGCEWPLRVWTMQPLVMSEMLITQSVPHVTALQESTCRAEIFELWWTLNDLIIASVSIVNRVKYPKLSPVITSNSPYWTAVTSPCGNCRRLWHASLWYEWKTNYELHTLLVKCSTINILLWTMNLFSNKTTYHTRLKSTLTLSLGNSWLCGGYHVHAHVFS